MNWRRIIFTDMYRKKRTKLPEYLKAYAIDCLLTCFLFFAKTQQRSPKKVNIRKQNLFRTIEDCNKRNEKCMN